MAPDAMKPVFRVAVILFAPMHDSMQKTAVGTVDVLRDRVRLIQIIVPEQCGGTHGRLKRGAEVRIREEAINLLVQLKQRKATGTGSRAQPRQVRRGDQALESFPRIVHREDFLSSEGVFTRSQAELNRNDLKLGSPGIWRKSKTLPRRTSVHVLTGDILGKRDRTFQHGLFRFLTELRLRIN